MVITVYRIRLWTEGVWSHRRERTNCILGVKPFRTREACQEYINQHLPEYTTRNRVEPAWVNYDIIQQRQYIPVKAK